MKEFRVEITKFLLLEPVATVERQFWHWGNGLSAPIYSVLYSC